MTREAIAPSDPGWLQDQVAKSVASLDSLPPKLRASLAQPTTRRRPTVVDPLQVIQAAIPVDQDDGCTVIAPDSGHGNPMWGHPSTVAALVRDALDKAGLLLTDEKRAELERAGREQAAQAILGWAEKMTPAASESAQQRRERRLLHIAARRAAGPPTMAEVAKALAAGDFMVCHLDEAGGAIPRDTTPTGDPTCTG